MGTATASYKHRSDKIPCKIDRRFLVPTGTILVQIRIVANAANYSAMKDVHEPCLLDLKA